MGTSWVNSLSERGLQSYPKLTGNPKATPPAAPTSTQQLLEETTLNDDEKHQKLEKIKGVTQQNKEKGVLKPGQKEKKTQVLKTIVPFGKVTSSCIMPVHQINSLVVNKKKEV